MNKRLRTFLIQLQQTADFKRAPDLHVRISQLERELQAEREKRKQEQSDTFEHLPSEAERAVFIAFQNSVCKLLDLGWDIEVIKDEVERTSAMR